MARCDVFYMSRSSSGGRLSQVATGLGIAEAVTCVIDLQELLKVIGKRCAIPSAEIERLMSDGRGAKAIDFLFLGGFEKPVELASLKALGVIASRPPQSVSAINAAAYKRLRQTARLVWERPTDKATAAFPAMVDG